MWELPGGYLDTDEDPVVFAAREVEEETGWRPLDLTPLVSFQPMVGTIDQPNQVYLARGAEPTGARPDINEAERIGWIPLDEVEDRIARGEIVAPARSPDCLRCCWPRDGEPAAGRRAPSVRQAACRAGPAHTAPGGPAPAMILPMRRHTCRSC
ncbi:MAG TPA: NUDIX hydrolase [Mycobacteriales bacterium]|nr:NUDIX hydrolase [Mycobacteriales bacterium]